MVEQRPAAQPGPGGASALAPRPTWGAACALSARLAGEWLEAAVADMPVIVAKKDRHVVGYLISASRQAYAGVPAVAAMLRAYDAAPSTSSAAPQPPKPTTMPGHA